MAVGEGGDNLLGPWLLFTTWLPFFVATGMQDTYLKLGLIIASALAGANIVILGVIAFITRQRKVFPYIMEVRCKKSCRREAQTSDDTESSVVFVILYPILCGIAYSDEDGKNTIQKYYNFIVLSTIAGTCVISLIISYPVCLAHVQELAPWPCHSHEDVIRLGSQATTLLCMTSTSLCLLYIWPIARGVEDEHMNILNLIFRLILPEVIMALVILAIRFWPGMLLQYMWARISDFPGDPNLKNVQVFDMRRPRVLDDAMFAPPIKGAINPYEIPQRPPPRYPPSAQAYAMGQPTPPQQGYPGQMPPQQGYPGQMPPQQGYPGQMPPQQSYPGQMPPQQGYPGQMPPQQPGQQYAQPNQQAMQQVQQQQQQQPAGQPVYVLQQGGPGQEPRYVLQQSPATSGSPNQAGQPNGRPMAGGGGQGQGVAPGGLQAGPGMQGQPTVLLAAAPQGGQGVPVGAVPWAGQGQAPQYVSQPGAMPPPGPPGSYPQATMPPSGPPGNYQPGATPPSSYPPSGAPPSGPPGGYYPGGVTPPGPPTAGGYKPPGYNAGPPGYNAGAAWADAVVAKNAYPSAPAGYGAQQPGPGYGPGAPHQPPAGNYGPGAPQQPPPGNYGAGQPPPPSNYGLGAPQPPAGNYGPGAGQPPAGSYGPGPSQPPAGNYGPGSAQPPTGNYGPGAGQPPAGSYGPGPAQPPPGNYGPGAPQPPAGNYGPGSAQPPPSNYGPGPGQPPAGNYGPGPSQPPPPAGGAYPPLPGMSKPGLAPNPGAPVILPAQAQGNGGALVVHSPSLP